MDEAWLLLVPVRKAVDLQPLQTKYIVIQLTLGRSRRVSVELAMMAVLPTSRWSALERSLFWDVFGFLRRSYKSGWAFCVGTGSGLSLSKGFGPILGLHMSPVTTGGLVGLHPPKISPNLLNWNMKVY